MGMDNQSNEEEEVSWWLKLLLNIIGTIGGAICLAGGIIGVIEAPIHITSITILISDMAMLFPGFLMLVLEGTFICSKISFADPFVSKVDSFQKWHRALLYATLCVVIVCLNFSLTTIGLCLIAFATATLYGFIALGRKASREEMIANARGVSSTQSNVNYENFA